MRTSYDPFEREADQELERAAAARQEHEDWSREQARRGNSADRRDPFGPCWVKTGLPTPERTSEGVDSGG